MTGTINFTERKPVTEIDIRQYKDDHPNCLHLRAFEYDDKNDLVTAPKSVNVVTVTIFVKKDKNCVLDIRNATLNYNHTHSSTKSAANKLLELSAKRKFNLSVVKYVVLFDEKDNEAEERVKESINLIAPCRNEDDTVDLVLLTYKQKEQIINPLSEETTSQFNTRSFMRCKSINRNNTYLAQADTYNHLERLKLTFSEKKINLRTRIDELKIKAEELKSRGHQKAADTANTLCNQLTTALNTYMLNPQSLAGHTQFKHDCARYIDAAKPELHTHRGMKQLLANLTLAVLGLGVFFGIACLINKKMNGHYLFFNNMKTTSDGYIDRINIAIENIAQPHGPGVV